MHRRMRETRERNVLEGEREGKRGERRRGRREERRRVRGVKEREERVGGKKGE